MDASLSLRIESSRLRLVGIFSKRGRDPREHIATEPCRILSAAYVLEVTEPVRFEAKDDASRFAWFRLEDLPALAFDHNQVIVAAKTFT
jgi:8-oxo-dGTP diphosphatase